MIRFFCVVALLVAGFVVASGNRARSAPRLPTAALSDMQSTQASAGSFPPLAYGLVDRFVKPASGL
jgi:hypothetical protein